MKLKEFLKNIKLHPDDVVFLKYRKDNELREIHANLNYFLECDVNEYKTYETEWIDPITCIKGVCRQFIVYLDEDEVRIVFGFIRKGGK